MSDSIIIPIATSPPPANSVKPASTGKPVESNFEDVLRSQTEKTEANGTQPHKPEGHAGTLNTEAAKPNQTIHYVEEKGEQTKPQKSEESSETEQKVEPQLPAPELTDIVLMAATPPAVPMVVELPQEDASSEDKNVPIATTPMPESAQPLEAQPDLIRITRAPKVDPLHSTTQVVAVSTETGMGPEELQAVSDAAQSGKNHTGAMDSKMSAPAPESIPVAGKQVEVAQAEMNGEATSKPSPEVSGQPARAAQAEASTNFADASKTSQWTQAGTEPIQPEGIESQQLKGAKLETTSIPLEEDPPQQVQAPPGQILSEVANTVPKPTGATTAQQIIEPARLAEAQTIDMIGQITRQMEGFSLAGKSTFRMQLSPQDLGQIDLKITSTHQGVGVSILAENAGTGKLLETQVAQLRQSLLDAGIQISNLQVGTHASQQQSSGSTSTYQNQKSTHYSTVSDRSDDTEARVIASGNTLVDYRI